MNTDKTLLEWIGEQIGDIIKTLLMFAVISLLLATLVAPLFGNLLCDPIRKRIWQTNSIDEIGKLQAAIFGVKLTLWIICIVAWSFLVACNTIPNFNMEGFDQWRYEQSHPSIKEFYNR